MGEYLSTPNREKKSEEAENGRVYYLFMFSFYIDAIWTLGNAGLEENYGGRAYS